MMKIWIPTRTVSNYGPILYCVCISYPNEGWLRNFTIASGVGKLLFRLWRLLWLACNVLLRRCVLLIVWHIW